MGSMTARAAPVRPGRPARRLASDPLPVGRRALRANAVYSVGSGAVALLAAGPLARLMAIDAWVVMAVGPGLLAYGLLAWRTSRRAPAAVLLGFAAADGGWVIGTLVLLLAFPEAVSGAGAVLLGAVALAVGLFGMVQAWTGVMGRRRR